MAKSECPECGQAGTHSDTCSKRQGKHRGNSGGGASGGGTHAAPKERKIFPPRNPGKHEK